MTGRIDGWLDGVRAGMCEYMDVTFAINVALEMEKDKRGKGRVSVETDEERRHKEVGQQATLIESNMAPGKLSNPFSSLQRIQSCNKTCCKYVERLLSNIKITE